MITELKSTLVTDRFKLLTTHSSKINRGTGIMGLTRGMANLPKVTRSY